MTKFAALVGIPLTALEAIMAEQPYSAGEFETYISSSEPTSWLKSSVSLDVNTVFAVARRLENHFFCCFLLVEAESSISSLSSTATKSQLTLSKADLNKHKYPKRVRLEKKPAHMTKITAPGRVSAINSPCYRVTG